MNTHDLKTHPEPFQAAWEERKTYEVRKDDRGFEVGDHLILREWDPRTRCYTLRHIVADVRYKTRGGTWGIPDGLCVLGIAILERHQIDPTAERGAM